MRDDVELVIQPFAIACARWRRRRRWRPCGGRGPRSPWRARFLPRSRRDGPSGDTGSSGLRVSAITAQRRAMASVLSQASGRSANSARMAAAGLNQCSGVTRRRSRFGQQAALGDAQQRVMRLDTSTGVAKKQSLVATSGMPCASASAIRPGSIACSIAQAVAVQFHDGAVGEGFGEARQAGARLPAAGLRRAGGRAGRWCRRSAGSGPAAWSAMRSSGSCGFRPGSVSRKPADDRRCRLARPVGVLRQQHDRVGRRGAGCRRGSARAGSR